MTVSSYTSAWVSRGQPMGIDALMYVKLPLPVSDQQIIEWSYRTAVTFDIVHQNRQYETRALSRLTYKEAHYCRHLMHDDTLLDGLQPVLGVNITCRYYGPGYERGPGGKILNLEEYLRRLTGGVVWYGGDNELGIVECTEEWRAEMWKTLLAEPPYRMAGGRHADESVPTAMCTYCQHSMSRVGGGGAISAFSCLACGDGIAIDYHTKETWRKPPDTADPFWWSESRRTLLKEKT